MAGLMSAPVFRLVRTWEKVASKVRARFEKIKGVLSARHGHQRLRNIIADTPPGLPV